MLTYAKPTDAALMVADMIDNTAHIPSDMLEAGIAYWRQQNDRWPQVSQLIQACADAERDHRQAAPDGNDRAAAYHRANVMALSKGFRVMQTDDGELYRLGDPGERRGIRSDGSAIVPWWHDKAGDDDKVPPGWYVRQEDAATLDACYRQYGAAFHMRGASIECGAA